MSEQSLVERVARRLEDFYMGPERASIPPEADMRVMFRLMARAAIAAMRVPTEAMCEIGNQFTGDAVGYNSWQAMIDAALAEGQGAEEKP